MSSPRLVVLAVGGFGARVAERLGTRYPGSEIVDAAKGTYPADWPYLDALVVAAEFDDAPLVEMVERAAFAWRLPWFPVLLEQAHLRVGPVVVPGRTACHVCFRRRRRQHARRPELWSDTPAPTVPGLPDLATGWAEHHVGLAYGLAVRAVGDAVAPTPDAPGGWVRTVELSDASVQYAGVVAVDGCTRCRSAADRQARTAALFATLQAAVDNVGPAAASATAH